MNSRKYNDLARSYVTLSNDHNLKLIALMFAEEATYYSSYFGTYTGKEAINKMMAEFFSRFPDAHWQVPEYRNIGNKSVEFLFVMTGTDTVTGQQTERHGLEQISFTANSLIDHIEVRKPE